MRAFISGRRSPVAFAIGLFMAGVLIVPGLAAARPGDTCSSNPGVISQVTICVSAVERPAGGCGACIPVVGPPASDVCPTTGQAPFDACCSNLSEAVAIAGPGDTIGVYSPTVEPAVAAVGNVGPNVIITGPFGSPFNSNQNVDPADAGLRIEECHNAKINAGDPDTAVIDIEAGAGNIIINGLDVIGGLDGIVVQNSGPDGTALSGIRAENNLLFGIWIFGDRNEVSGSIATGNDFGFVIDGSNNLVRSNKGNANLTDGVWIFGNANDIRGNETNQNGLHGIHVEEVALDNVLRSNQSNRSPQNGPNENGDCEYVFDNDTTVDAGGNKKDNANFVGTILGPPKRFAEGCYE